MEGQNIQIVRLRHLLQHSQPEEPLSFEVSLISHLAKSSHQEVKSFSANPSEFLKNLYANLREEARKVLYSLEVINISRFYNLRISLTEIPFMNGLYRRLGTFTSEDVGRWVVATGTVIQATQTKALEKSKLFVCDQCGAQYRRQTHFQTHYRFDWPPPCSNMVQKQKSNNLFTMFYKNLSKRKGKQSPQQESSENGDAKQKLSKCGSNKFTPTEEKKICIDYQEMRLQEQFKHISAGRLPQSVVVVMEGPMGATWRPGDDLVVSGVLEYRFKKPANDQRMQMQLIIVANTVRVLSSSLGREQGDRESLYDGTQESIHLSLERIAPREKLSQEIELRNAAIAKFCPNIYGRDNIKLGIMLGILGGVSIHNQQTRIRGQSHILLVGEPGTGKSVFLKEAANLADRSFFTNAIGTSSAGLSVSYIKDGSDWTIEPGALVLADNGVCCIDELTLLSKKDQNSLLQAMEQQTVSSAKASVVGRLNARTTLICACNPITPSQKYDPSLDLQVNTGLSIPLLTRFDLILILKDEGNASEDAMKCEHILGKFTGVEGEMSMEPSYHKFSLRQLIRKCKLYQPELRGGQLLSKYYIEQRKNSQKVTTARAFESLCRLTEAHAKLMMRDQTTSFDCLTAIMLTQGVFASSEEEFMAYAEYFSQKYGIELEECLQD